MFQLFVFSIFIVLLAVMGPLSASPLQAEALTSLGGAGTIADDSYRAFSFPFPSLARSDKIRFQIGDSFFSQEWQATSSGGHGPRLGLGPLFNATSCQGCHVRDGRGRVPQSPDVEPVGLLFRISLPERGRHGEPIGIPGYGTQLSNRAITGFAPEASIAVDYELRSYEKPDGQTFFLRWPKYEIRALQNAKLPQNMQVSARIAPATIGLGLLEAIPEATIRGWADPEDRDQDGISGRINMVWDLESKSMQLGRFGWKANQPNLRQQNASAFFGDLGVTSSLLLSEACAADQPDCGHLSSPGDPELSDTDLALVTFYTRFVAVPAQRDAEDFRVQQGKQVFVALGCEACHKMNVVTAANTEFPQLSQQTIHPFTDLLLHDMGEDLADHRPEFGATGREWRTPPLWGLGLHGKVSALSTKDKRELFLLHDGRARSIPEAILWHGGEAANSRQAYLQLTPDRQDDLLVFLQSL